MKLLASLLFILVPFGLFSQHQLLQSGPMPGYSELKEAVVWLQTKKEAKVFAKYWIADKKEETYLTNTVFTDKEAAFTAHLIADSVEPGLRYQYDIYINNKIVNLPYNTFFNTQKIWKWRTGPPAFDFIMGSCAYINETSYDRPGDPYGDGYEIYSYMAKTDADFMIWLGDNLYFREPDWNSWAGITHRYTHDRAIPELQEFLTSTHHYAIWDDHDYGPNNSDRGYWNKNQTMEAFKLFWANPSYGTGKLKGAITYFQFSDADFYLLDNRTYRTPNNLEEPDKTQLGEEQLQWLLDNLVSTWSTFKFIVIGGQFLSNSGLYESYTNYGFEFERQKIIDFIYKYNIKNVIFLTGDVHFSEISVLKKEGFPTILDITSSPLNSGVNTNGINQDNTLRLPESVIMERNYTQVSVTGTADERKVRVNYFDVAGEIIYTTEFSAEYEPKAE